MQYSFRIDKSALERTKAAAATEGVNVPELMRRALASYLDRQTDGTPHDDPKAWRYLPGDERARRLAALDPAILEAVDLIFLAGHKRIAARSRDEILAALKK